METLLEAGEQTTEAAGDARPILPVLALACAPAWRAILEAEGFDVTWCDTPDEAFAVFEQRLPVAVISGVLSDATHRRRWAVGLRTLNQLRRIPWVVVAEEADDALLDALEAGADDFVLAATESGLFGLRLRALLRMIERLRIGVDGSGAGVKGTIGPGGTLPLLRYCETHRITGRLTITGESETRWLTFQKGELLGAGPDGASDPVDAFLKMHSGTYVIDQVDLGLDAAPATALANPRRDGVGRNAQNAADEPTSLPVGRLSRIECRGQSFQIQTEGRNQPNFTTTTIVDRDGRTMRKIESAWPHALRRHDDCELARACIDRQHEGVARKLRELDAMDRKVTDGSDVVMAGSLLTWAAYFIVEHGCTKLGTTVADAILRRTHARLVNGNPALTCFQVVATARVELDAARLAVAGDGMLGAIGAWLAAFVREMREVTGDACDFDVRQITALMERPLEKIGFYQAFDSRPV